MAAKRRYKYTPNEESTPQRNGEMWSEMVLATPDYAHKVLKERNKHNRPFNYKYVSFLANQIINKTFKEHHQGIAFSKDGVLLDGQHRLAAIIEANIPVMLQVSYNVPDDSMIAIDDHLKRSVRDAINLHGNVAHETTNQEVSIAKFCLGVRGKRYSASRADIEVFLTKHSEAIKSVSEWLNLGGRRPGIGRAGVRAAILSAYYVEPAQLLERFCAVLWTGEMEDKSEQPAITLRNALQSSYISKVRRSQTWCYLVTQRAIMAMSNGEKLAKMYCPQEDLYPFPGIVDAAVL